MRRCCSEVVLRRQFSLRLSLALVDSCAGRIKLHALARVVLWRNWTLRFKKRRRANEFIIVVLFFPATGQFVGSESLAWLPGSGPIMALAVALHEGLNSGVQELNRTC